MEGVGEGVGDVVKVEVGGNANRAGLCLVVPTCIHQSMRLHTERITDVKL